MAETGIETGAPETLGPGFIGFEVQGLGLGFPSHRKAPSCAKLEDATSIPWGFHVIF